MGTCWSSGWNTHLLPCGCWGCPGLPVLICSVICPSLPTLSLCTVLHLMPAANEILLGLLYKRRDLGSGREDVCLGSHRPQSSVTPGSAQPAPPTLCPGGSVGPRCGYLRSGECWGVSALGSGAGFLWHCAWAIAGSRLCKRMNAWP